MFWFKKKNKAPEELNVITYAVGERFPLNRQRHGDGCAFEYLSIGPAILMYYSAPTNDEIKMIENEAIDIGLLNYDCLLYVIASIGGNIVQCPFNINLYPENQLLKNMETKQDLAIFLIDADTNIVKVMRLVEMTPNFANALWSFVDAQFSAEFDKNRYNALVNAVESQYSIEELCHYIQCSMHCDAEK